MTLHAPVPIEERAQDERPLIERKEETLNFPRCTAIEWAMLKEPEEKSEEETMQDKRERWLTELTLCPNQHVRTAGGF